jgi:hypothetical protein
MDPSELLPSVRQLAFLPHLRDLAIAYALAFLIDWNREREDRSAGMRTFPAALVAVAACGFVRAAEARVGGEPEALARIVEGSGCTPRGRASSRTAWSASTPSGGSAARVRARAADSARPGARPGRGGGDEGNGHGSAPRGRTAGPGRTLRAGR